MNAVRSAQSLHLLPLWEKVARTKVATDEGSASAGATMSLPGGPKPLTRIASFDAMRPLPQGERWTVSAALAQSQFIEV